MKRFIKSIVLVAVAAMALPSCQKNEIPAPEKQDVHFTINAGVQTKTHIEETIEGDQTIYKPKWDGNEELGLLFAAPKEDTKADDVAKLKNTESGDYASFEGDVRQVAIDNDEEIYVVTGVAFSKIGENKTIKYTTAKDDTKQVPVTNYFYKLVLRVETTGSTVTDAYAVGFWFENKVYSGTTYTSNIKSVDEIEQLTGFDFFVNLPDSVENKAEAYTSWVNLKAF